MSIEEGERRQPGKAPGREQTSKLKRFYKAVTVEARGGSGFAVLLDRRMIKTPGKRELLLPTRTLADAVAAEWIAQGLVIAPLTMPMTRLSNTAIERVAGRERDIVAEIVDFAGSDLLCYRADHPRELVARQVAAWDPVLEWARAALDVRLVLATGVMPIAQPEAALKRLRAAFERFDAFELCALHNMTTLTGSAVLALAVSHGRLAVGEAWTAAHIDEDWQIEQWGADELAAERRAHRWGEMAAAGRLMGLVREHQPEASGTGRAEAQE
jgi:chaperone required for assembly of F1-ATPase